MTSAVRALCEKLGCNSRWGEIVRPTRIRKDIESIAATLNLAARAWPHTDLMSVIDEVERRLYLIRQRSSRSALAVARRRRSTEQEGTDFEPLQLSRKPGSFRALTANETTHPLVLARRLADGATSGNRLGVLVTRGSARRRSKAIDLALGDGSIWALRAVLRDLKQQLQEAIDTVVVFASIAETRQGRSVLEALAAEMGVAIVVVANARSARP